jgi:microcystin-dependent protein
VSTGPGEGGSTAFGVTPGEASQVALTEQEQVAVTKLLGDPTYFPIEFRRWLKDFMDNADLQISPNQITGGGAGGASGNATLLPAGMILPYAGTTFGKDCLVCNGQEYSREDFSELFSAIGVAWGTPSDNTKFKVPDLRDRALYGIGSVVSLAATDGKSTGNRGGPNHHHDYSGNTGGGGGHSHSLSLNGVGDHTHSVYAPAGSLIIQQGTQGSFTSVANYEINQPQSGAAGAHSHSGSTSAVANHSHPFNGSTSGGYGIDQPSFAGIQYVITTGKSSTAA